MPRKFRLEYEGAIYHVMNRGDQREDVFPDDENRRTFLVPDAKSVSSGVETTIQTPLRWELRA